MSFRKFAVGEVIPPEDAEKPERELTEAEREAMSQTDKSDLDYADNDRSDPRR